MVVTLLQLLHVDEKKNLSFFFFLTNLYMKQGKQKETNMRTMHREGHSQCSCRPQKMFHLSSD